jgi:hypothetical protein
VLGLPQLQDDVLMVMEICGGRLPTLFFASVRIKQR